MSIVLLFAILISIGLISGAFVKIIYDTYKYNPTLGYSFLLITPFFIVHTLLNFKKHRTVVSLFHLGWLILLLSLFIKT